MAALDRFSALVGSLYQAALAPEHWAKALQDVAEAIGASKAALVLGEPNGEQGVTISNGVDPDHARTYEAYYGRLDPVVRIAKRMPAGSVLTTGSVLTKSEIARTEFYADWGRRQEIDDCLIAPLLLDARPALLCLGTPPGSGEFQAEPLRLLRLLIPHLQTAVRMRFQIQDAMAQRDGLLDTLSRLGRAIFFVDAEGRIVLENQIAREMLRKDSGITYDRDGLRADLPEQTFELRRLIASAAGRLGDPPAGGTIKLDRRSDSVRPLIVTVAPLGLECPALLKPIRAAAMVIATCEVEASGGVGQAFAEIFGLTPAEAGVAELVALGRGVKAASASLGIAPSTARTHLQRAYAKTRTRRQAELAHLASQLGTAGPVT